MRIYSTLLTGVMACTLTFVSCTKSVPTTHSKTLATEKLPSEKSEYMDVVQKATFRYFWDFGHPISGMAAERTATPNIVTTGGTGFGLMGMVVAAERQWITREAAVARVQKIADFLEKADRFHGAWSHWIDGNTGRVVPFGQKDNGGDLVETAFLTNGLLVAREYFNGNTAAEKKLRNQITKLWEGIEWDWYVHDGKLRWHWSKQYNWDMNMPIEGYNECLITYVLALGSPTHAITPQVYENTWKQSNHFTNGNKYMGYKLDIGFPYGGPLFFSHYSYLSMDPRRMQDQHTNYWQMNQAHTLINWAYCAEKAPKVYGYSEENWGLTASDDYNFYDAHSPTNDNGTITPTAALSAFPYTPYESWQALRYLYLKHGNRLFGEYGFYDAYNASKNWYSNQYLAIDQGPIVVMIENYRTGLIWKVGERITEIQTGLKKMGIENPSYPTGFYAYQPHPTTGEWSLMRHSDTGKYPLEFAVAGTQPVTIELTGINGTTLKVLDNKTLTPGTHIQSFDAAGGKYVATITQGSVKKVMKLVLR
ncbi:glucoamylase family protein [Siphonobacter sp. BAB-5405]|uniref:glucoamylase family protein n=1 Tax=Siphonobacter sp. BAB-5405 TaxID=1864825 RepID=UPI001E3E8E81|nr:glucoamylase family protein [Siphonobacter sp. BAB-5405]